ncbi:MAG: peroxidase-related enzyme [Hyphomicrobiaceae bacterium]|nr:peroxidase-related enzyme [Hyphomicrobiaceae bacterium]
MSRLHTSPSVEAAPTASQPLLQIVKSKFGSVPNLFRVVASSPAALEGYLGLNTALSKGRLSAQTGERIALAVAEINGCSYCLSAHTYIARNVAKLDDVEISANRNGASNDPKADAAVKFAVAVVKNRGHVSDADVAAVRQAGFDDAEIVEIVLHVALNTLTNYVNEVAGTEIDFPVIARRQAA